MRHIFDDLYQACIMGRGDLGSSTLYETATILWETLQIHEVMVEFSKPDIKRLPSITSIFVRFLITAKILEPIKEISQMKRYIKVLSTKSDHYPGRLANLKE